MTNRATIHGSIERVTYHNAENGFCVLRVAVKNRRDPITVVGNASQVMQGEDIEATGIWINDRNHGLQLKADSIQMNTPTSIEGIKKYLASGLIKGIGKHFAGVLVNAFKEDVFNVLDNTPDKVHGLPGIGTKRTEQIIKAWQEQLVIRKIMVFLHGHGIGTARAVRIYKTYGEDTIEKLTQNPYSLALDIWGIGFKTADQLAQSIGIDKNSVIRAEAGLRHLLSEHSTLGHCAILPKELVDNCTQMLEISHDVVATALDNEILNENIIQGLIDNETYLFLAPLFYAEQGIANNIHRLQQNQNCNLSEAEILQIIQTTSTVNLSDTQKQAVITSTTNKVSIITGGPGVGKTTIVRNIIAVANYQKQKITVCAPTGRAAKRLSESSGMEAKTIHRLLEYKPGSGARYNQDYKLDTDCVIIDEVSMVDVLLMNTLLKAVPDHATVLFVGDVDQLPSVGPGSVLRDMINSGAIATTKLTEIFRQAQTSKIITNAHRINKGDMPVYTNKLVDDFFFIPLDEPEEILLRILSIVADKLAQTYNINPLIDAQVLVPMNKGTLGAKNLNSLLQERLNKNHSTSVTSMGLTFRVGDKVIQTVNNYDKDVFNGDVGYIESIDLDDNLIIINFDGKRIEYDKTELDEINLAYAITIHKSQGSEYPIVVIPVTTQHYTLLERNLLYTGVTRGKKVVILVGQKKALFMAIKRISAHKRITSLDLRLAKLASN